MLIAVYRESGTDHAYALIAKARSMAPEAVLAVLSETPETGSCSLYGADRVYVIGRVEDDCAQGSRAAAALKALHADIALFPATVRGRFLSAWAAARLGTGLTADCTDLGLTPDGLLLQTRPAYGSHVIASILCREKRPQMASVRPGVFSLPKTPANRPERAAEAMALPETASRLRQTGFTPVDSGVPLQSARVVIAGGKGIGGREGFRVLERLAALYGGAVGATRSAVDAGWIGYDRQIGQTGVTIRPRLYIAFGISGMPQHLSGITSSGTVVAVNTDRNAPIFSAADYGIVAPWRETAEYMISYLEKEGKDELQENIHP